MNKSFVNTTRILSLLGIAVSTSYMSADSLDQNYSVNDTYTNSYDNGSTSQQSTTNGVQEQAAQSKNKAATVSSSMSKKTQTAAEQGYQAPSTLSADEMTHLRDQATNSRQMATKEIVPTEKNPVIKNKRNATYIKNWAYILQDLGVSQEKTYFEASRLDKEDFEDWANGIYNALSGKHSE